LLSTSSDVSADTSPCEMEQPYRGRKNLTRKVTAIKILVHKEKFRVIMAVIGAGLALANYLVTAFSDADGPGDNLQIRAIAVI
jgi:hypothetical protein